MRRSILCIALIVSCAFSSVRAQTSTQGQLATDVELKSSPTTANTINNCRQVTFIFRSSYTGTVGGIAFTSTDAPLTIRADNGSVLRAIPYTVTAGTLVVVQTH